VGRSGYFRPNLPVINTKEIPFHGVQQADPQGKRYCTALARRRNLDLSEPRRAGPGVRQARFSPSSALQADDPGAAAHPDLRLLAFPPSMILLRIAQRLPAYRHHHGKPDSSFLLFGFVRRSGVDKLQREQPALPAHMGNPAAMEAG
jgi:hypothetical protein